MALADPDGSAEGFELDPDERALLVERREELLGLIGRVLRAGGHDQAASEVAEPSPTAAPAPPAVDPATAAWVRALPELTFAVRLSPVVAAAPGGAVSVSYTASILPMGASESPASPSQPAPEPAAPSRVEAAVRGVREAADEERFDKLVALAAAVEAP